LAETHPSQLALSRSRDRPRGRVEMIEKARECLIEPVLARCKEMEDLVDSVSLAHRTVVADRWAASG
jgi:hypothetical protein